LRLGVLLLFAFAIAICLAIAFSNTPIVMGALYTAGALAAIYILIAVAIGKTQIVTSPIGIRRDSMFGTKQISWDQIAEYRYRILSGNAGAHGGLIAAAIVSAMEKKRGKAMSFQLVLKGADGTKLTVTSNYKDAHRLRDTVIERIHPRIIKECRALLERQQPVVFGPLVLKTDGIAFKKKDPVPLGEIAKIDLTTAKLRIKRTGKMFDAISVGSEQVPNVMAFVQLAMETTEKRTMRPMAADTVRMY
jgi:hypothetical protein